MDLSVSGNNYCTITAVVYVDDEDSSIKFTISGLSNDALVTSRLDNISVHKLAAVTSAANIHAEGELEQKQTDWNETDPNKVEYIKNKPDLSVYATTDYVDTTKDDILAALGKPLQWKGPSTVAQLNAGITGIQEGWTYTLTDAGTLTDGSIEVEAGDEVAWTEDGEWFKVGSETAKVRILYGRSGNPPAVTFTDMIRTITKGYYVILDISETFYPFIGSDHFKPMFSNGTDKYTLNMDNTWSKTAINYVEVFQVAYDSDLDDFVWPTYNDINTVVTKNKSVCIVQTNPEGAKEVYWLSDKTSASANINYQFISGLRNFVRIHSDGTVETGTMSDGNVKNGGALTDAASVTVPNNALSTLATAQATLTLNVNVGANEVPNFAVEVTPSVDVTLTVTKTVDDTVTTLNPSAAGGNSLTAGNLYQVTCVGSCWTLAEFTAPTP